MTWHIHEMHIRKVVKKFAVEAVSKLRFLHDTHWLSLPCRMHPVFLSPCIFITEFSLIFLHSPWTVSISAWQQNIQSWLPLTKRVISPGTSATSSVQIESSYLRFPEHGKVFFSDKPFMNFEGSEKEVAKCGENECWGKLVSNILYVSVYIYTYIYSL
jgi:hypothetical protein